MMIRRSQQQQHQHQRQILFLRDAFFTSSKRGTPEDAFRSRTRRGFDDVSRKGAIRRRSGSGGGSNNNGGERPEGDIKMVSHLKNLFKEEAKARASGSKLQGGNAPKSGSNSSRSGGFAASGGNASSSNSSPNALVSSGHESMHRKVIAIPLDRRPIMPGIIMPVRTFDMTLVAELEDMKKRGQAYVGAFLKKERVKESQKEDNSNTSKNGNKNNKDTDNNGAIAGAMKEDVSGLSVGDLEYDPASELHDIGTFASAQHRPVSRYRSGFKRRERRDVVALRPSTD